VMVWWVLILVHEPGNFLGSGENPNFFFPGANKKIGPFSNVNFFGGPAL